MDELDEFLDFCAEKALAGTHDRGGLWTASFSWDSTKADCP